MPNPIRQIRKLFNKSEDETKRKRSKSLDISEPFDFHHAIHIGIDSMPNGNVDMKKIPEEWEKWLNIKKPIEEPKIVNVNNQNGRRFSLSYIRDLKKKHFRSPSCPEIGKPYDFRHLIHVTYNDETRTYIGLPLDWEEKLTKI